MPSCCRSGQRPLHYGKCPHRPYNLSYCPGIGFNDKIVPGIFGAVVIRREAEGTVDRAELTVGKGGFRQRVAELILCLAEGGRGIGG